MDTPTETIIVIIIISILLHIISWILHHIIPKYKNILKPIIMCCLLYYLVTIKYETETIYVTNKILIDKTIIINKLNISNVYDIKIGDSIYIFSNVPPFYPNLKIMEWIFSPTLYFTETGDLHTFVIPINYMFPTIVFAICCLHFIMLLFMSIYNIWICTKKKTS